MTPEGTFVIKERGNRSSHVGQMKQMGWQVALKELVDNALGRENLEEYYKDAEFPIEVYVDLHFDRDLIVVESIGGRGMGRKELEKWAAFHRPEGQDNSTPRGIGFHGVGGKFAVGALGNDLKIYAKKADEKMMYKLEYKGFGSSKGYNEEIKVDFFDDQQKWSSLGLDAGRTVAPNSRGHVRIEISGLYDQKVATWKVPTSYQALKTELARTYRLLLAEPTDQSRKVYEELQGEALPRAELYLSRTGAEAEKNGQKPKDIKENRVRVLEPVYEIPPTVIDESVIDKKTGKTLRIAGLFGIRNPDKEIESDCPPNRLLQLFYFGREVRKGAGQTPLGERLNNALRAASLAQYYTTCLGEFHTFGVTPNVDKTSFNEREYDPWKELLGKVTRKSTDYVRNAVDAGSLLKKPAPERKLSPIAQSKFDWLNMVLRPYMENVAAAGFKVGLEPGRNDGLDGVSPDGRKRPTFIDRAKARVLGARTGRTNKPASPAPQDPVGGLNRLRNGDIQSQLPSLSRGIPEITPAQDSSEGARARWSKQNEKDVLAVNMDHPLFPWTGKGHESDFREKSVLELVYRYLYTHPSSKHTEVSEEHEAIETYEADVEHDLVRIVNSNPAYHAWSPKERKNTKIAEETAGVDALDELEYIDEPEGVPA